MGGARAGEIASSLAAAAVKATEDAGTGRERVVALIQEANRSVYQRSTEDADDVRHGNDDDDRPVPRTPS